MSIAFIKNEQRILEYYFKAYEVFGCNKTFTSMMFQEIIATKNPQEGIAKLRFGGLVEKAEQLNGKFGYKLLDMKKIVEKASPDETIKILNKFSKLKFVDSDNFPYEVAKTFNGKAEKNNLLQEVISHIPFNSYKREDKAKITADLFSTAYSNLGLMTFAYKLLGCPEKIGEVNTNLPVFLSAIGQVKDSAQAVYAEEYKDIADLFGIKSLKEMQSYDYVISDLVANLKHSRDLEQFEETIKKYDKKAVCLSLTSLIANGGNAYKLRQELVLNNQIDAVIALSKKSFLTRTLFMPVIIVLSKEKNAEKIQFINAANEDDLHIAFEKILAAYNEKAEIEGFSKNINGLEVVKNDYCLEPATYVQTGKPKIQIDLFKQVQLLETLEKERTEAASSLKKVLAEKITSVKNVKLSDICTLKKIRITKNDLESKFDEDCIFVYASSAKAEELGTPYYPLENYKPGDYAKVVTKDSCVKKEYLYQVFNSTEFKNYVSKMMKGTVIKVVSTSDISKFTFKLPEIETQERIITLYKDLENAKNNLLQTLEQMNVISVNILNHIIPKN